jgi:hypothetical protein
VQIERVFAPVREAVQNFFSKLIHDQNDQVSRQWL